MSAAPVAGWYQDPTGRYSIRYWDGRQWSDQANSGGANVTDPTPDEMRYVPPAPGTAAAPATAPQPTPTLQVTQQAPRSSAGVVLAVVLSLIALGVVVALLLTQSGDDETDTTEPPVTTEAPAVTEAPATTAPPSDG